MLEAFSHNDDPQFEVTTLRVSSEDDDGRGSDTLDFLDDILKDSEDIDLNGLSSDESYMRRIDALRACFVRNQDYIARHYEQPR